MSEGLTFIPFSEYNRKYDEVVHFFLQVEGNEAQLEILKKLVDEADPSGLDTEDSSFAFGKGKIDEHAANQLKNVSVSRGEVCACWGKLVLPFTEEQIPDDQYDKARFLDDHFCCFRIRQAFYN
jgi:hypothetical protein